MLRNLALLLWTVCHAFVRVSMSVLKPALAFFTGFCLIANGAYLSLGTIDKIGDAGQMLRLGTPPWLMWTTGLLFIATGLALWHIITKPHPQPSSTPNS
jgi:hypothetical protein